MIIWAVTLGLAIVAVLVTRGSFFALARVRLRALWLLVLAAALQVALTLISFPTDRIDDVGFALLMASYALLLAFSLVNVGLRGMGIVVVGVAMNAVVIGLNQGMPVTEKVWRDGQVVEEPFERTVKHKPATDDDLLPFLSDIILLPEMFNEVISFGDLVIAIGVIDVAFWGSRRRRHPTGEEDVDERAGPRHRHHRRRRRRRKDDVGAPEPVFIDLTESEPEPEPVGGVPIEAVDGPASGAASEPPPIRWTAPPRALIDLSAFEEPSLRRAGRTSRDESDPGDRDAAPLEESLEGEQDTSVVDVPRP